MLRYQIDGIDGPVVWIRIVEQDYRGIDFFYPRTGRTRSWFRYTNFDGRIDLASDTLPYFCYTINVVCVRGTNTMGDDRCIRLPLSKYSLFKEAVDAYNKEDWRYARARDC